MPSPFPGMDPYIRHRWCGEASIYDDPKDLDKALDSPDEGRVVLSVWWD